MGGWMDQKAIVITDYGMEKQGVDEFLHVNQAVKLGGKFRLLAASNESYWRIREYLLENQGN